MIVMPSPIKHVHNWLKKIQQVTTKRDSRLKIEILTRAKLPQNVLQSRPVMNLEASRRWASESPIRGLTIVVSRLWKMENGL